jgi:hypothetical protein
MMVASLFIFKPSKPENPKTISKRSYMISTDKVNEYSYKYNRLIGIIISVFVGYFSGLLE